MCNAGASKRILACISGLLLLAASCSHTQTRPADSSSLREETPFHADNDIAMTVRSLVDAIRVGETLRAEDYDFRGILTDGQGTPLYTDVEGNPGEWAVVVSGDSEAVISNEYLGDLMSADLRNYILSSLNVTDVDFISAYENPENEGEIIYYYDTGEVDLKFSTMPASAPSGLEGIIMSISISKKL